MTTFSRRADAARIAWVLPDALDLLIAVDGISLPGAVPASRALVDFAHGRVDGTLVGAALYGDGKLDHVPFEGPTQVAHVIEGEILRLHVENHPDPRISGGGRVEKLDLRCHASRDTPERPGICGEVDSSVFCRSGVFLVRPAKHFGGICHRTVDEHLKQITTCLSTHGIVHRSKGAHERTLLNSHNFRRKNMSRKATFFAAWMILSCSLFAAEADAASCLDQTLVLTGQTAQAVSTSGDFTTDTAGWKVFDDKTSRSSRWLSESGVTPAWVAYDFQHLRLIQRYSITSAGGELVSRSPRDFELQGWDGEIWVTLDRRTGETAWAWNETRSYMVQTPGSYSRYRLYITDDNDVRAGVAEVSVGELFFETCFCENPSDRVPVLTGSSSSVSTSGTLNSSYPAWQVFDEAGNSMWISEVWETPAWLAYDFGSGQLITEYTLMNNNGPVLVSRAPKDFELQGRHDGSWVTLDVRSEETDWISGLPRTYSVSSPGIYEAYRLYVTDDNDIREGVVVISLGNFELSGCDPETMME